ncbi:MAG TPA: N-acetylglutamate synthase, partial [Rhodocyclaceae bacterium]
RSAQRARSSGVRELFVLTTQTTHWFIERGFVAVGVERLPDEKQLLYNYQRRSKVLILPL